MIDAEPNPKPITYEIVAVPAETPVTTPVAGLTVATEGLLLDHTAPGVAAVNVVVAPAQMLDAPVTVIGVAVIFLVRP